MLRLVGQLAQGSAIPQLKARPHDRHNAVALEASQDAADSLYGHTEMISDVRPAHG